MKWRAWLAALVFVGVGVGVVVVVVVASLNHVASQPALTGEPDIPPRQSVDASQVVAERPVSPSSGISIPAIEVTPSELPKRRRPDATAMNLGPEHTRAFGELRASRFCRASKAEQSVAPGQSGDTEVRPQPASSAGTDKSMCASIKVLDIAEEFERLRALAELGLNEAQIDFVVSASEYGITVEALAAGGPDAYRFKQDAMRFLESAASGGSLRALELLSGVYDVGVLVPQDPIKAYAHVYALAQAGRRGYPKLLAQREQALVGSQIETGRRLGIALYESCCRAAR